MNRRIKKKKEKQVLMAASFDMVPNYPYKKRKEIVNKQWKMFTEGGIKIETSYKKQVS